MSLTKFLLNIKILCTHSGPQNGARQIEWDDRLIISFMDRLIILYIT